MSAEDTNETDKNVIELLYSSSVVGVGLYPQSKEGRNLARGSKSLVNERFDIQFDTLNQNKLSELFNGCSKIIFIIRIHKRISLFLFFFFFRFTTISQSIHL